MNRLKKLVECRVLFAFVLSSLLISSLTQQYLGHVASGANADFYDYYFAAQAVHDNPHANLYEGATNRNPQLISPRADSVLFAHAKAAGFDHIEMYIYPPLLADLLVPLSQLPPHLAAALWRAFNLALVLTSVLLLSRMMRVRILSFEFVAFTMAAYCFWPNHEAIVDGQITILMLALWTIGIVAYFDDRMILSAAIFALATAFKVTPILMIPIFLLWKERRWLVSYIAVLLSLVLAMVAINGPQTVSAYPMVMSAMSGGVPALENKSLSSLVAWVYYGKLFTRDAALGIIAGQPRSLLLVATAISGVFYLSCLFVVWRSRHQLSRTSRTAIIAVFGMVAACVSPVSWRHGYSVAFVALAIFWVKALRTPQRALHVVLLTLTTFTLGSLLFDRAAQAPLPQLCKILLAASWVVFSILLSLDVLVHAHADDYGVIAGIGNPASLPELPVVEHSTPSALPQDAVG
jgi:hypothetical protein